MQWLWRDIQDNMWIGDTPINDKEDLRKYKMKWKVNNKTASISEKRAEWDAVRQTYMGFIVDRETFRDLTVLYF